ncbi:MAG TPA: glycine zipper 2TM domain-containing protein [Usitatibacter sp.]|nr:glycine zipper 2TM domain-containing protein [Usitatibacter sp.]
MKKLAIAVATLFTVAAPFAQAYYDRGGNWHEDRAYDQPPIDRGDLARVIDSRPVYADNGRREECWSNKDNRYEEAHDRPNNKPAGTAAGAVVGGVVGHQFDNGSAGATLGGALIGGLIGNRVAREHDEGKDQDIDYSRCRVLAEGDRVLQGYETRYEYRGREYTAMLPSQPGPQLRVDADGRVY